MNNYQFDTSTDLENVESSAVYPCEESSNAPVNPTIMPGVYGDNGKLVKQI